MTEPEDFDTLLRPHLDRVSRSFALCIRQLQEPMRSWTGLAYLLFRLLDTVEDALWLEPASQMRAFDALEGFLQAPPSRRAAQTWAQTFPAAIDAGEAELLQDSHSLLVAVHALPTAVLSALRRVALTMSCGMRHYARAWTEQGSLVLADLEDVNRYCYFVAGVVGELLTDLFAQAQPNFAIPPRLWTDAQHFGLFLQKVNLLKDQRKDEGERRFLVPDRGQLLGSLPQHAQGALRYLTALPQDAQAFRTFCAWSVFLGAASLPHIEADHTADEPHKISRAQTQALLQQIAAIATDNAALTAAMDTALTLLPKPRSTKPATPAGADAQQQARRAWFLALDHGPLSRRALGELGMAPVAP
jgi:phytoene/squalene synthetase